MFYLKTNIKTLQEMTSELIEILNKAEEKIEEINKFELKYEISKDSED